MVSKPTKQYIHKKHLDKLYSLISLLIILSLVYLGFNYFGSQEIREIIEKAGFWAPITYIIVHSITIIIAPLGGEFIFLSSGFLFGFWQGVFYSILAGYLGAFVNFWLSRIYGRGLVLKLIGKKSSDSIQSLIERFGKQSIFVWLPFMSTGAFDLLCYVAGFTDMKFSKFVTLVTISSLINVPLYVGIGAGLIENDWKLVLFFLAILTIVSLFFWFLEKIINQS